MLSNKIVQVLEVLNSRDAARKAYELVLARPTALEVAKKVICLLIWLETIMGVQVIGNIAAMAPGDVSLTQIVAEAIYVYDYIFHASLDLEGIPTIMALCSGGRLVDIRFFKFHKDLVARGITVIRENIGVLIFDDNIYAILHQFNEDTISLIPAPLPPSELLAPFVASTKTPSEDSRMAFVAFSKCQCHHPNSEDIVKYFEKTLEFGRCIERVEVEQPPTGQAPKHGIIVFLSSELRDEAMLDETATFFRIDGHDTWVQLYMPPL